MSEETQENHIDDMGDSTGQPVTKQHQKQTPSSMLSSATFPVLYLRGWTNENKKIRQKLSGCIEIDDQFLRHDDSVKSRRWRSSKILRSGINMSTDNCVFFALVNSNMAGLLAKRRWSQEEIPILRGSQFTWNSSLPSGNSKPFWRKTHWSYIARQRVVTERRRRAHVSRWKLSWLTLHHPVWIDSGWGNVKKGRRAVFFTTVNPMFVYQHTEVEYDLTNPSITVHKYNWKDSKIQFFRVIWGLLKEKGCSSTNTIQPNLSFNTYPWCASRRW